MAYANREKHDSAVREIIHGFRNYKFMRWVADVTPTLNQNNLEMDRCGYMLTIPVKPIPDSLSL